MPPSVVVVLSVGVVEVAATLVVPIEPSKATTPHARANVASVAATTRCRANRTRRALAARSSWALVMGPSIGAHAEAPCEDPERILGE